MANQNFRVKNGINVGTAVTVSTTGFQVGSSSIHSTGITAENVNVIGIITAPNFTGTATTATKLETARTFQITGDIVASPISFDGTGNVSLAATIQPDSVGLGTDTVGDYVQSIFGTSNQITVTGGNGEGSTPIISIPSNPTLPGNVTIANDLQVNRNLNVTGNITIGGTNAYIIADDFRVKDGDIVLGFTTNTFGQDVSNDTTANHGGVAIASTEGTPLVQLFIAGIETNPPTYKKIMWFKSGSFAGLNTDAWLSNYAIGIGSTQFPNGTRLAAGNVQITENDLSVVRNINATGISTFGGLVEFDSSLRDIYGNVGAAASVLISTGAGVSWTAPFAAGIQGIQGTQGIQGLQGVQGTTGAQGIQGIQGITGVQGVQGTQGITGAQGATGSQGTIGATGSQGTTGSTGTQGIQGAGGLTTTDATTLNSISAINLYNNMAQNHTTRTGFDATTPSYNFGYRFVQGSANGPGTGGSQFYSWYIGLGADYAATGGGSYGAMFAIDRNSSSPYLSIRYNEANSFSSWYRVNSGNGARAWVNFNGTNGSIRGSFNISSVTRNGTGDYTINITTAMVDTNYAVTTLGGQDTFDDAYTIVFGAGPNFSQSTGSVRLQGTNDFSGAGYRSDITNAHVAIFR